MPLKSARKRATESRDRKLRGESEPMSKAGRDYQESAASSTSDRAKARLGRIQDDQRRRGEKVTGKK